MNKFGLIGENVSASFSPFIHHLMAEKHDYRLFSIPPEKLKDFLLLEDWKGLNVTLPYKQSVIPFTDELSPKALHCGSVNTLSRRENGSIYGDNTDYDGLLLCLKRLGIQDLYGKKVLILGSGGTSKTAQAVVGDLRGQAIVISRRGKWNYQNISEHNDAFGLINTSPVGGVSCPDQSPVDLTRLPSLRFVMDVIYRPLRTPLLLQAETLGIPHIGGLPMLIYQAAKAREIFDGCSVEPSKIRLAEEKLLQSETKLILVGMPGCGKSTLSKLLGLKYGMNVIDTDEEIEKAAGMTIEDIFREQGEASFRKMETGAIQRACGMSEGILSVGGGAVLSEANRLRLKQSGFVLHVCRNTQLLAANGRPLSQGGLASLLKLEEERMPLYRLCRDASIINNGTPEEGCRLAWEAYHEYLCHQRTESEPVRAERA